MAQTWRSARALHQRIGLVGYEPQEWYTALRETLEEVVRALTRLESVQAAPTGAAADALLGEIRPQPRDPAGRATFAGFLGQGEDQQARTVQVLQFGLDLGDPQAQTAPSAAFSAETLARIGTLGAEAEEFGKGIH